jgi:peptide/nickel transport system substrate-binding protein
MIADAVAIEDPGARSEAYAAIADKLQSEAASVFLLHEHAVWGTQADVANFEPHPQEYYVLTADLALGAG